MNFYTLIFKRNTLTFKRWTKVSFMSSVIILLFIILINYIVDPYNITKHNFLDIEHKLITDDRAVKLNHFSSINKAYNNILLGSSRVYSINPRIVTNLIGGSTYNFGVGSATIEDIMGIIKYLQKTKKLPKNIILGVDFYTFNKDIALNKRFLKNKQLNFISYGDYNETYVNKLFSLDALQASIKILKINFIKKRKKKVVFDAQGWAGKYEDYSIKDIDMNFVKEKKDLYEKEIKFYSNNQYMSLDKNRVRYLEDIKIFCKDNGIRLFIFNTPLHPLLLKHIEKNNNLKIANREFLEYLNSFENFTDLYYNKEIYSDLKNFKDITHTTSNAGDIILRNVLKQKD